VIGKTGSGAGFGGLTRYLLNGKQDDLNPGRVLWTSTRELAFDDPREAALVMRMTAAQGQTDKPVQHFSISLAPGEHLTREQWEQVIDTTLRDLKLEGHQALVVAHQDTAHEHVHIMVNRVHPETHLAWDRWQDRPRLMASLRVQEVALGLQETPHVKDPDRVPDPLVQQFERTAEPPILDYARAVARPALQEAPSWRELHERLAEVGLYLERKGQGLVVTDDHRHVKASNVDRGASLRALEGRLGPYEERRPLLQEIDRDLRANVRERELAADLVPLNHARQERSFAAIARDEAAQRLETAGGAIRNASASAYRDPAEAANRYLAHLEAGGALQFRPAELGQLQGAVVRIGRNYLPVGAEGARAYQVATETLPQLGALYVRAREDLAVADTRLERAGRQLEQLEQRHRPQLAELQQLGSRAQRADLPERVLSLRPRDQIALARAHGAEILQRAAERDPQLASRTADLREWWMRNLSPQLDRALDRQLTRLRQPSPAPGQSPADWLANAVREGLRPAHGIQALTRAGVSLAQSVQASSRVLSRARAGVVNPAKSAAMLAAKALGVPALPVRLASAAWTLARTVARTLIR
jgi:hypothetical protein